VRESDSIGVYSVILRMSSDETDEHLLKLVIHFYNQPIVSAFEPFENEPVVFDRYNSRIRSLDIFLISPPSLLDDTHPGSERLLNIRVSGPKVSKRFHLDDVHVLHVTTFSLWEQGDFSFVMLDGCEFI
jgi:hypothetical protein